MFLYSHHIIFRYYKEFKILQATCIPPPVYTEHITVVIGNMTEFLTHQQLILRVPEPLSQQILHATSKSSEPLHIEVQPNAGIF